MYGVQCQLYIHINRVYHYFLHWSVDCDCTYLGWLNCWCTFTSVIQYTSAVLAILIAIRVKYLIKNEVDMLLLSKNNSNSMNWITNWKEYISHLYLILTKKAIVIVRVNNIFKEYLFLYFILLRYFIPWLLHSPIPSGAPITV